MDSLDNVRIIAPPPPDVFVAEFLRREEPVIIRGLFTGQPIDEIRSVDTLLDRCGGFPVMAIRNYVEDGLGSLRAMFMGGGGAFEKPFTKVEATTFRDYVDAIRTDPATPYLIGDAPAPAELVAMMRTPEQVLAAGGPEPAPTLFMANRGNASDLHTDWHCRFVMLHQVFGRKRAIMFPPQAARKLLPVEIFGTVRLRHFSDEDKMDFVRYAKGYDCVLEAGDALLIPRLWWHHLEYVETGLAISYRYGAVSKYAQVLRNKQLIHRDHWMQNILAKMLEEDEVERSYLDVFETLKTASERSYPSPLDKYRALHPVMLEACARIYGPEFIEPYTWISVPDLVQPLLAMRYEPIPAPAK